VKPLLPLFPWGFTGMVNIGFVVGITKIAVRNTAQFTTSELKKL